MAKYPSLACPVGKENPMRGSSEAQYYMYTALVCTFVAAAGPAAQILLHPGSHTRSDLPTILQKHMFPRQPGTEQSASRARLSFRALGPRPTAA